VIRPRIDRWFVRFCASGDARALARVFDATAPELWRVAAHLCRDRHDAEDAVQQTFVVAIEQRARWDASRSVLPWLIGTLVNRVREQRRRRARDVDAARLGAPAGEDPVAAAELRELGETLRAALATVGAPFRAVVERHLLQGRSPAEIAAELDLPAATVRTRLHRGIAQLRRRLPATLALGAVPARIPPATFAALRANVVGDVSARATALTAAGAAAIGAGTLATLALGLAAVATLAAVWLATNASRSTQSRVAVAAAPQQQLAAVAVVPAAASPGADAAHGARAANDVERVAPALALPVGELRVRVVHGATKAPLAGRTVQLRSQRPEPPRPERDDPGAAETAGAAGVDDVPTHAQGSTDADGAVTLRIAAGPVAVFADGGLPTPSRAVVLPGTVAEHVHEMAVTFTADVLVCDRDGAPVPGARLVGQTDVGEVERELGITDAQGRWRDERVERQLLVRAMTPGRRASAVHALSSSEPVVLELGDAGGTIDGVVVDERGTAIPNATVVLEPVETAHRERLPRSAQTDAHGGFRCEALVPGEHDVLVDCRQREPRRVRMFRVHATVDRSAPVELRCLPGGTVEVRLAMHDGRPLPGVGVSLAPQRGDLPRAFAPWLWQGGSTNDDGRAVLGDFQAGRYELSSSFHQATWREQLELRDGEALRLEHTFPELTTLAVEVADENGALRDDVFVNLRIDGTVEQQQRAGSTGKPGRVRFERVTRGDHGVMLRTSANGPVLATHVVSTDTVAKLVLPRALPVGTVVGRLVAGPGVELPAEPTVQLLRVDRDDPFRHETTPVAFDAASRTFTAVGVPAGTWALMVSRRDRPEAVGVRAPTDVRAGTVTDLGDVVIGTGRLVVDVTSRARDGVVHAATSFGGSDVFVGPRQPAADRRVELPQLAPGHHRVLVWGEHVLPRFAEADIAVGATTTLAVDCEPGARTELRLPGSLGVLEVRFADGTSLREFVIERDTWTRGFPRGAHRVEFTQFGGARHCADVVVGNAPGAPIELQPAR
jgi:RNA polymerase sigma factor (sigma-70 family)